MSAALWCSLADSFRKEQPWRSFNVKLAITEGM